MPTIELLPADLILPWATTGHVLALCLVRLDFAAFCTVRPLGTGLGGTRPCRGCGRCYHLQLGLACALGGRRVGASCCARRAHEGGWTRGGEMHRHSLFTADAYTCARDERLLHKPPARITQTAVNHQRC